MKEKWLNVKMTIGEHKDQPFLIGRFKGYSDKVTADRKYREVVAYDALYDIINKDVAAWYNSVFPSHEEQKTDKDGIASTVICHDPITMKQFRDSFFNYFGIEQADTILVNDSMYIEKTVEVTASGEVSSETTETSSIGESMSGQEVLSCICEINGCMGHMGRDGKFHYIYLEQEIQGVYPKNDLYPADDLYPKDPKSNRIDKDAYISAEYEDYLVKPIDRLQIREQKNDIGVIIGTGNNGYVIEDNFLVYGKGTNELTVAANNIFSKIKGIIYRPYQADCKGNPCLEVGDAVRFTTRYELIESYILSRTLNGIQALRDEANVKEAGEVVLNAKLLSSMISRMPAGQVSILSAENGKTTIQSGVVQFEIQSMPANDFPELPNTGAEETLTIKTGVLRDMIDRTLYAVSQDEKKPAHTGELFEIEPDKMTIVALDGYRLAIVERPVTAVKDIRIIVPSKTMTEVSHLLPNDDEEPVHICANRRYVVFMTAGYTIMSRLIEGEFLNYHNVIPAGSRTRVTIDTKEFIETIERASLIITERLKNPLRITFTEGKVVVRCQTNLGRVVDEFNAECEGDEVEIGFNNRYLLDALRNARTEKVRMEISGPLSPVKVLPVEGNDFLYLVLPVRFKND